jgi:hypothetical protein
LSYLGSLRVIKVIVVGRFFYKSSPISKREALRAIEKIKADCKLLILLQRSFKVGEAMGSCIKGPWERLKRFLDEACLII